MSLCLPKPAAIEDGNEARAPGFGCTFALSIAVLLCHFAGVAALTAIEAASPLGRRSPTLNLTIDSGLYVLSVHTWWEQVGGTRQYFSIAVQEP